MASNKCGFPKRRRPSSQAGFTLAEVLVCVAVIAIAFVGLLTVIPYSAASTQSGNQTSTATFLANQGLEEAKGIPWTSAPANDCLGVSASATAAPTVPAGGSCTLGGTNVAAGGALPWFANEGSTAITSPDGQRHFDGYSRNIRITSCGVAPGCNGIVDAGLRLATVSVTFQPMTTGSVAAATKTVTASMYIAQR
jgi:prepilin-type N-terminal cleavage/methylation domain-containing protein